MVIEGSTERPEDVKSFLPEARDLVAGGMRKRDAAHAVAERHDLSANAMYRALVDEIAAKDPST